jgi:hypothetical protein
VVEEAGEYSSKEFKKLLPQVKGVSCTIDTKWHNRIVVSYPAVREPFSKGTPFGPASKDGLTVQQAFHRCAAWAWAAHLEKTGEECPYDFTP